MEVARKILEFLDEPEFCEPLRKFSDSRKWVATLSRKKAITDAHLQSIQSKPTSDEANDSLLTLIKRDPSIKKLKVLSEALKEDDTHDNQLALAKMIDQFLVSMVKDPAPRESNGVSINHEARLSSVGLDITSITCCKLLQSFLMNKHVDDAKSVMESLYQTRVRIISDLLKSFKVEVINGAVGVISAGILVKGKKVEDVKFAESTEEVLSNLDIPRKWNDLSVLRSLLTAIQVVHPSSYQAATAVLDHYQDHLILYQRTEIMMKNKQSLQDAATSLGQDEVEVKITLKDSIFQLRYESCDDLWLVVLAEGSGIPRHQIKLGSALPGNSSVITFHIPKRYIGHIMKATQKGPVIWAMLELRVIRIEVPGYFNFEVNWNTATLPIRDSLLTNRDLFRNTKGLSDTFQATVDLMPPLPGKKGLPLQKYKPRLSSGFFTDVLVFDPVEKGSESTEVLLKSLQALQHLKKQPNNLSEMEKLLTKQMKMELDALFETMESSSVVPRKAISSAQPLTVENPKLYIISKNREMAELQDRIAHLQKMVEQSIGQRALEQKDLDLERLQGQVVDIRASNQALFVKKTQVECERDDLQKKYSELQKKYSDAEKRVVDMEKKHDDAPSDLEKKLTKIDQELVKQAMLEVLKEKEIEQLKEIPQAKERIAHLQETVEQKDLDIAKLQGQVVDLESLRSNYQALLVKKTQVECERDELQKKYSEAVKRVVDMEKKNEEGLSDFEKKVTVIHQEEIEQEELEKATLKKYKFKQELDILLRSLSETMIKHNAKSEELDKEKKTCQNLQSRVDTLQNELEQTKENLKEERNKVEDLSTKNTSLQKYKKNSESEVEKLSHTLAIREEDLHAKLAHIEQLNRDLGVARQGESQVPILEENIATLKKEIEEYIILQSDKSELERKLHHLQSKVDVREEDLRKIEATLKEVNGALVAKRERCAYLTSKVKELEFPLEDKELSLKEKQDLISQLERDISNYQSRLEQQEMSYKELKKVLQQVNEECERTKSELERVKESDAQSRATYIALYREHDRLRRRMNELLNTQDLISQLERDISNYQSCLEQQEMFYDELKKVLQQVNEEYERTKDLTVAMNVRTKEPIRSPSPLSGASSTEAMPNSLALQSSVGMITSLSSLQPSSTFPPSILRSSSEPNEVRPSLDTVPSDEDLQVYIVNKCASQYRTIGTLLRLDYETIDSVRGNASLQSVKDKCFELLMHWKRTRAAGENTWRVLLDALKYEDTCRVVVEELERALNS